MGPFWLTNEAICFVFECYNFLLFRTVDGRDGGRYPMEDMNVLNELELLNFW